MSMSDCVKCWETPCVCGHDYKDRSTEWIEDLIRVLQKVLDERKNGRNDKENQIS